MTGQEFVEMLDRETPGWRLRQIEFQVVTGPTSGDTIEKFVHPRPTYPATIGWACEWENGEHKACHPTTFLSFCPGEKPPSP